MPTPTSKGLYCERGLTWEKGSGQRDKSLYIDTLLQEEIEMSTREKEEEEEGEKKISNEGRDNGEEDESIFTDARRISGESK